MKIKNIVNEFAPANNPSGGNYLKALASAWYNGTFNTGDLHKGIKSQEDVERILERGIHCGDGKVRKYSIGYNSDFDGVEIQSDDHYEYSDYDDAGRDIDSRTGKPWGPYDVVAFGGNELDESKLNEYGDTARGQKMLTKVQKRAVDRVTSKKADTNPKYAKKNSDTADRAWDRMTDKDVAEGKEDKIAQLKKDYATAVHWSKNDTNPHKREAARQKAEKIKGHLEKQYKQGVAEGTDERKRNAMWAQITSYEKRAKETKNDIKKDHLMKMASELRAKLPTTDEQNLAETLNDLAEAIGLELEEGALNEFAPGGNSASSYYAVTANFVNDFAQQKQEEIQDLIDAGWTKQDLAQAGTQEAAAADIAHLEQVRDGFLKGLKPGFDAYLQGDTQMKDQLGASWIDNDLPLNQDWEKIYGEPWGDDGEFDEGVAEGSYDNDKGITHTRGSLVAKLEALPKGSDDFEWNRIQAIHHLKQGNMLRAKYYMALMKRGQQGVAEGLNEFSFDKGDDDDQPKDDPYKYPKPEQYRRSIDFFGKFEADHFDREDMDDATGVFKGYWYYGNNLKQIAYFKFDNPQRTGSNDPGMGWYYEPQDDDVAEATGDEKFDKIMRKATGDITPADAAEYWPTREYEPIDLDPSYLPSMAKYKAQLYPLAYNWWSDGGDGTEEAQLRKLGWEPSYGDDYVMVVLSGIGHDGHIQYNIHDFDADDEDLDEGNKKPEQPEADYGDDYQAMVKRMKQLAGAGPLKTVYDPTKRVYKNMPTATQPGAKK